MPSQPSCFDVARYLISYSQPDSSLRISATTLSSRQVKLSSTQEPGVHQSRIMSTGYPAAGGIRNGFGRYRMANHEQLFHIDEERFLGYPNPLISNTGHRTPTPMSYTPIIPQGSAPTHDALFNTPMESDDRRRRSSAVSPRTIRASTYHRPYINSFPLAVSQTLTPPSSNNFANHTIQAQADAEQHTQAFPRPSLSTISSITKTSTTSAYTETPTATHGHNQRAIFALLSSVCTEALRRKWHDETQRQLIHSLTSRRPRQPRPRQRSHGRYSPYAAPSTVLNPPSQARQTTQRRGATTAEQPLHFMALMQRIATATWENARRQQQEQHHGADAGASVSTPATIGEAETAAIDSMRTLYSLGNSIVAATEAAARGENFNLDEMRDVVGVAGGFCRFLGYAEGAERCEEVGRGPFGAGAGDGGRWEGGVF